MQSVFLGICVVAVAVSVASGVGIGVAFLITARRTLRTVRSPAGRALGDAIEHHGSRVETDGKARLLPAEQQAAFDRLRIGRGRPPVLALTRVAKISLIAAWMAALAYAITDLAT